MYYATLTGDKKVLFKEDVALHLKLSENGGNVRFVGQIGENLQLQRTMKETLKTPFQEGALLLLLPSTVTTVTFLMIQ